MAEIVSFRQAHAFWEEAEDDHKAELRTWLRLFASATLIENEIRRRLRDQFSFTLPRFDLLAQLYKAEDGLGLGEMSKRLMVSPGNVTAITERLIKSGYISRTRLPEDRRVQIVRMTHAGRAAFKTMAEAHSEWITDLFSALNADDLEILKDKLTTLKTSLSARVLDVRE